MIKIIDFTNCVLSSRNLEYAGRAGEKRGKNTISKLLK